MRPRSEPVTEVYSTGSRAGRRLVSNALALASSQIVTWVLSSVFLILLSRYLPLDRVGDYNWAVSLAGILGMLIGLGMETLITRSVARRPESGAELASAAIVVRMGLFPVALAVLLAYILVVHVDRETSEVAFVLAVATTVASVGSVFVALFQGHERMSFGAQAAIVRNVLSLLLLLLVVAVRGGVVMVALIMIPVEIIVLAIYLKKGRTFFRFQWPVQLPTIRRIVISSLSFWANQVVLQFYIYVDSIILASLGGSRSVALYAAATRIFSVALFVPTILGSVTMPLLSRRGLSDGEAFAKAGRKTVELLIVASIPVTIALIGLAGMIMYTLFGAKFNNATMSLEVLSLCIPFTYLSIQYATMLAAQDKQWLWTRIMIVASIVNPLANLVAIPLAQQRWHNPAVGASIALVVTEILMAGYGSVLLRDVVHSRGPVRTVVAALIVGGIIAAIIHAYGSHWLLVSVPVGLAAYGGVVIACGVVPREDVGLVTGTLWRRLPGHSR